MPRYNDLTKDPLADWEKIDPAGYLARRAGREPPSDRLILYERRIPRGFYHYRTRGACYNSLMFYHPNGASEWLGEHLAPEEVAAIAEAGAETHGAAQAVVSTLHR